MRVISINVNGIRSSFNKGLFSWLENIQADVVCLQEIRADIEQLNEDYFPENWYYYYNSANKKGYSGTAIYTKKKPDKITTKTNWHFINDEGRFTQIEFADLSIISLYLPSGTSSEIRQNIKMDFLENEFKTISFKNNKK